MNSNEKAWREEKLAKTLREGGLAVMPTDTIYGIVARAEDPKAVERVYKVRGRDRKKPCIILIGRQSQLKKFSVRLSETQKRTLGRYWPGPVSVVLDCLSEKFSYLHRGTKTLAFRLPDEPALRKLLLKTGPVCAPSANAEGAPPARNILEAKKYFGKKVDFYASGGESSAESSIESGAESGAKGRLAPFRPNPRPSRVIRLKPDGSVDIIRE